jgi:sulfur relay (sulfurtransferase) complex TusBCD TusD component (DsrE family)
MKCKGRCKQEVNSADKRYCTNKLPNGELCMHHQKINLKKMLKCRVCGKPAKDRGYCGEHLAEKSTAALRNWYNENKELLKRTHKNAKKNKERK